ncbi:hypothetical protein C8J56DRAFT_1124648 [Mycena floridula]|nr:hypothetical protein C8J56DRAFT_1124648 [Mycena floridula]
MHLVPQSKHPGEEKNGEDSIAGGQKGRAGIIIPPDSIPSSNPVQSLDILRWAMMETCTEITHFSRHWAEQGLDYQKRSIPYQTLLDGGTNPAEMESTWLQAEARSLESMYGVQDSATTTQGDEIMDIPELRARLVMVGVEKFYGINKDEEQERELSHEVELERQIERPPKTEPAEHSLDPSLRMFIATGIIPTNSSAIQPLWTCFPSFKHRTQSLNHIYATKDFSRTVVMRKVDTSDIHEFLRPVHWILSGKPVLPGAGCILVIISPFEANELLPLIRTNSNVHLHLYAPRVLSEMKTFEDLKFNCIPTLPESWVPPSRRTMTQLNLFAGQLYFNNFSAYQDACNYLGLDPGHAERTDSDGFVRPEYREQLSPEFTESPVLSMKDLISARRKGNGYGPTHVGKMLQSRAMSEEDFH